MKYRISGNTAIAEEDGKYAGQCICESPELAAEAIAEAELIDAGQKSAEEQEFSWEY